MAAAASATDLPGGVWTFLGADLHPLALLFALSGTLMISKTLRIPKLLMAAPGRPKRPAAPRGQRTKRGASGPRRYGCSFQPPFSILTMTWLRASTPLWSVGLML